MTVGIVAAEIHQPVVIDPQHFIRGRQVVHFRSGAGHAKNDFGVDAVTVHVLGAQMRVADAADVLLAVGEKPSLGHDVDALVLAWDQLRAARPDAVLEAEIRTLFRHPLRSVRPVGDKRHAILELA